MSASDEPVQGSLIAGKLMINCPPRCTQCRNASSIAPVTVGALGLVPWRVHTRALSAASPYQRSGRRASDIPVIRSSFSCRVAWLVYGPSPRSLFEQMPIIASCAGTNLRGHTCRLASS